jgi:hypothetical protein
MRPLRTLLNELVERRLWPVALLLVLALVAVPLLLAKPAASTDDGAPPATSPPEAQAAAVAAARAPGDTAPGGEPVVAVAQAEEPNAPLRGRAKNPFRQQHLAADPSAAGAVSAGTASSAGGSDTSGSAGSGDSDGQTQTPSSPQETYTYTTIDVRFGKAGLSLRRLDDVPRLTPLPSAAEPIVVFLGMRADRQTAVFLVSTDVHAQGDGKCVPSRKTCEAIELTRGDVALLDFADADGSVTQYELDLVDVVVHQTTSKALASRSYARTSRAGARLLEGARVRTSADVVVRRTRSPFRYAQRNGVLHIAPWASRRARMGRAQGGLAGASLSDLP